MITYNLEDYFTALQFNEEEHKYTVTGSKQPLTSVTTFVKKFIKPFQAYPISIAAAKSKQRKGIEITAEYLRKYWKLNGQVAMAIGNRVHFFAENMPHFDSPKDLLEESVIKFYKEIIEGKEQIVSRELRCFFKGLSGTVDLITADNEGLIIRDYKTSADLNKSYGYMTGAFSSFKASQLNQYTLQLLLYDYIVRMKTGHAAHKLEIVKISAEGYELVGINEGMRSVFNDLIA